MSLLLGQREYMYLLHPYKEGRIGYAAAVPREVGSHAVAEDGDIMRTQRRKKLVQSGRSVHLT